MKLKEYKEHIDKLIAEGHGNSDVYYSCDDEGNDFTPVHYTPSINKIRGKKVIIIN